MTIDSKPEIHAEESPKDAALIALFAARMDYLRSQRELKSYQAHPKDQKTAALDLAINNLKSAHSFLQIPAVINALSPTSSTATVKISSDTVATFPTIKRELLLTSEGIKYQHVDAHGEPAENVTEDLIKDWALDNTGGGKFGKTVRALAGFTPDKAIDSITTLVTKQA